MGNQLEEKVKELKKICKDKNMRITDQRIEIFKELFQSKEHPDAEMLFYKLKSRIPNLSLDTIYRTLDTFAELGVIFRVDSQLQRARFDADLTPHYHFICTKCGTIADIHVDENIMLPEDIYKMGDVKNINLQICGICKHCLEEK